VDAYNVWSRDIVEFGKPDYVYMRLEETVKKEK